MANTATSIKFDGADDFLIVEDTSIGRIGDNENPGPFTMEVWVKVDGHSYGADAYRQGIASRRTAGQAESDDGGWFWDIWSSRIHFGGYYGSEGWLHGGGTGHVDCNFPTDNGWHHCVVERIGDANVNPHFYILWIDGTLQEVHSKDGTGGNFLRSLSTDKMAIGNNAFTNEADSDFDGYIDEFRFSHTARYGNFDAPTASTSLSSHQVAGRGKNALLPEHTKILIESNANTTGGTYGASATNTTDQIGVAPVTNTDLPTWSDVQAYKNGLSLNFNGTDDCILVGLGEHRGQYDDFSMEAWVWADSSPGTSYGLWWGQSIGGNPGTNNSWFYQANGNGTGGGIYVHAVDGTGGNGSVAEGQILHNSYPSLNYVRNQWVHVVHAYIKGFWCWWTNGQLAGYFSASGATVPSHKSTRDFAIGASSDGTYPFKGYMDSIRYCSGASAYTPHFNPYGGQKNVVHDRGGAVTDARLASANTHAIQMGRAAIGSDAATNANTYCIDFEGWGGSPKGDHYVSYGKDRFESNSEFSIFGWIYVTAVNGTEGSSILFGSDSTDGNKWWALYITTTGYLQFYSRNGSPISTVTASSGQFTGGTLGVWKSVGVTHDGTTTTLYVDGTSVGSGSQEGWDYGSGNINIFTIGATNKSLTANADVEAEFYGKMIGLAMWSGDGTGDGTNGVLTAAQISALHSAGKSHDLTTATGVYTAAQIDDLAAYWRFGNHYLDTTETLHDVSGNGNDVHAINTGTALTYTTGTTFLNNWQHRGYFTPDKYTTLLLQSSTNEGATTFQDTGPGFKRMSFDGTNDLVKTFPDSADWDLGTGDFCVATWIKIVDNSTNYTGILTFCDGTSATSGWGLGIKSTNEIAWWSVLGSDTRTVTIPAASYPSNGTWNFIVVSRTDFVTKIFLNGTEMDSQTDRNAYNAAAASGTGGSQLGAIGRFYPPENEKYFKGQIAQLGFWKGSGLTASQISSLYALEIGDASWNSSPYSNSNLQAYYTFGNTLSESPADSGTNLYDRSTDSDQDLAVDGATAPFAGHTLTATGTSMTHSTAKSVFGGSSMSFDGSDDYITASPSSDFDFGTGPFTIEGWINSDIANNGAWLSTRNHSDSHIELFTYSSGQYITAYLYDSGSGSDVDINAFATYNLGHWHHVALVREGTGTNETHFYVDGILKHSSTYAADLNHSGGADLMIGAQPADGSPPPTSWAFNGYLDEIRMSSGIARYTKSIERFANTFVAKGDTGDAYTALQIQSNGAKNGTNYSDSLNRTGFNTSAVTVTGSPIWKNTVGDGFGGANTALYLDGTSELVYADSTDFEFPASTEFTIEMWFNLDKYNTAIGGYLFSKWYYTGGGDRREYSANVRGTGESIDFNADETGDVLRIIQHIPLHTWHHYVVQRRKGGVLQAYLNGVLGDSAVLDTEFGGGTGSPAADLAIGASLGAGATYRLIGYLDQFRLSKGIARYGGIQLRTTQQTHVSANSDSGVVTSNSTFGSGDNIFSTDGHTALLLNADEGYSNTHVAASANAFLSSVGNTNVSNVTTTYTVTVASGQRLDGTTGNIYYINGYGRPALTLVRDNHYIISGDRTVIGPSPASDGGTNGAHPFKFATGANGPEYTTGVEQEYSGTNSLYKISPTSATPDSLHYYCGLHNNMGFTISVVDSTGSDGTIAPTPIGVTKADGTTTANFPVQRQGISAYGANSYFFDGTNDYLKATTIRPLMTDSWRDNGFCGEMWLHPLSASTDGVCSFIKVDDSNHLHMRFHDTHGFVVSFDSASGQVEILDNDNDEFCKGLVNSWYHVAVQITNADARRDQQLQLWINGNLFLSKSMSDKHFDASSAASAIFGWDDSNYYYGYMDSIRLSNKERINYTSSNAKLGTNAVHHSDAKLLITSNTFNGNTHFDDFSDQGNYWNQQPFSYFFDGTDDIINLPTIKSSYGVTGAVWFRSTALESQSQPNCNIYNLNVGYRTGLHYMVKDGSHTGTQSESMALFFGGNSHFYAEGSQGTIPQENQEWHCAIGYHDSVNGASATLYVDGISVTLTDRDGAHGGTATNAIGGLSGELFTGRIAQVAFWDGNPISASEAQAIWQAGPTANWMNDYSDDMLAYYGMGNHNELGGRPADSGTVCFDRSGNGRDSSSISGTMRAPSKGTDITAYGGIKHSTDIKNFGSSSIFFDGTDDYLQIDGERSSWDFEENESFTFEMWINMQNPTTNFTRLAVQNNGSTHNGWALHMDGTTGNLQFGHDSTSIDATNDLKGNSASNITANVWHHIAIVHDKGGNRLSLFKDGKIAISRSGYSATQPIQNWWAATDCTIMLGRRASSPGYYYKGYMDEIAIYRDIAKYTPVATGLGSATVTPSYLDDPTGNHFTSTGLAITDQMLDTPENNFCTWNAIHPTVSRSSPAMMAGEGNLQVQGTGAQWNPVFGTMGFTSGKWYYETKIVTLGTTEPRIMVGWAAEEQIPSAWKDGDNDQTGDPSGSLTHIGVTLTWSAAGYVIHGGTTAGYDTITTNGLTTKVQGDIIMCAIDLDNNRMSWGHNGIWYGNINPANGESNFNTGDPSGTGTAMLDSSVVGPYTPFALLRDASSGTNATPKILSNFGQGDPDGENNFTDGNGRGGFRFEPPQGFVSLCTANMKDADYAPLGPNSAAGTPDKHYDAVLYSGTSMVASNDPAASSRRIGGLNFQPDMVLIKNRGTTDGWVLQDSVRGWGYTTKLSPYDNSLEHDSGGGSYGNYGFVSGAFDGGFEICPGTSPGQVDKDTSNNFVAFSWKAGNETTINNDGATQSTVSVNQDAGFSIVSWTGPNGTATTVGHGLSQAPEWMILKNRNIDSNYAVYHKSLADDQYLRLDTEEAAITASSRFNSTDPTATVFSVGTDSSVSGDGDGEGIIAYCWHGVEGYSKFGSYEGNGNADGPFVYLGFKPALIIVKNIDQGSRNWQLLDNKRSPINPVNKFIRLSVTTAETSNYDVDFLSNGFKIRNTDADYNESGQTFVYMTFAEMPFKYATAR